MQAKRRKFVSIEGKKTTLMAIMIRWVKRSTRRIDWTSGARRLIEHAGLLYMNKGKSMNDGQAVMTNLHFVECAWCFCSQRTYLLDLSPILSHAVAHFECRSSLQDDMIWYPSDDAKPIEWSRHRIRRVVCVRVRLALA